MYKTELHVHTFPCSGCAKELPEDMVDDYIANGYSTVVMTNHMSPAFSDYVIPKGTASKEAAEIFLSDYLRAKARADDKINVLLGMEVRFRDDPNDYLVYGVPETFLQTAFELIESDLKSTVPILHENGMVIYQAHPFRDGMRVTNPNYIDGIEAGNFCDPHHSRNDIAMAWAERFGLRTVYGSDYHSEKYMKNAGILTENEIKTNADLLKTLYSMNFEVTDGENIIIPPKIKSKKPE